MEIGKYKQAMSYLLNSNATLKTFVINPDARLIDNDPEPVEGFAEGGRVGFQSGGSKPTRSTIYKITRANHPEQGKYAYHGFNMKTKYFDTKKEAEDFRKFRLQNKAEQQTIKITDDFIKKVKEKIETGKSKIQVANELKVPVKRIDRAFKKGNIKFPENIVDNLEYRSFVKKNYKDKTTETIAKELFTDEKIPLSTKKSRVHQIIGTLIADGELEPIPSGLKSEVRKARGFGENSQYEIQKAVRDRRDKLISEVSSTPTEYQIQKLKKYEGTDLAHRLGLEESSKLGQEYDIGNLGIDSPKLNQEIIKSYEYMRDNLVTERDALAKKIKKNSSPELRQKLFDVNEKIKQVIDASGGRIQGFVLDEKTLEPIKYLGINPKELAYGVIDESVKDFNLKEINKIIRDANKTGTTTPENWEKIKKYQMFTANLQNEIKATQKENVPKITKELEQNSIELLNRLGCGDKYANGGRIKFGKGSNCYIKGLEKLKSDEPLAVKDINVVKDFLQESGVATSEIRNLTNLAKQSGKTLLQGFDELMIFGRSPLGRAAGYGLGVALPAYFAGEEALKGNYKQAGRELLNIPTLGFGLPESWVGSNKTDLIKHAKEKGLDADAVEKFFNKNEISKKINDAEDLLKMGSTNENFIKSIEDKKQSLYDEYDNIKLSPSDIKIFEKTLESFTKENYEKTLLSKDMIEGKTQREVESYKKSLDPDFIQENKINISPNTIEPYQENLPDYYKLSAADGGRVKLADGGGPKFTRRGALGLLGALAATPLVKSLMKGEKLAGEAKLLKTANLIPKAKGMPEWFPSLVARIEKEGKFPFSDYATTDNVKIKELIIPSKTGKGPNETYVMTKYPDGKIEIQANIKGGSFNSPFELHYTPPKSDIDVATGKVINEPGEFNVLEQRPRPVGWEGSDLEIDYEYMSHKDAISDLERVEKIATGKRIHPKRVEERTAARKIVEERPYEDVINRYPDPDTGGDWWDVE